MTDNRDGRWLLQLYADAGVLMTPAVGRSVVQRRCQSSLVAFSSFIVIVLTSTGRAFTGRTSTGRAWEVGVEWNGACRRRCDWNGSSLPPPGRATIGRPMHALKLWGIGRPRPVVDFSLSDLGQVDLWRGTRKSFWEFNRVLKSEEVCTLYFVAEKKRLKLLEHLTLFLLKLAYNMTLTSEVDVFLWARQLDTWGLTFQWAAYSISTTCILRYLTIYFCNFLLVYIDVYLFVYNFQLFF